MEFLTTIKEQLPDWAKDIRLNLDAVIARSTLAPEDAIGAALSAAYAARSPVLVEAFKSGLSEGDANAALHGEAKPLRDARQAERDRAARVLDAHRRDTPDE